MTGATGTTAPPKVAVVGAGWAGLAAAVALCEGGARVSVFEAARTLGGRARRLTVASPQGAAPLALDNGQHILIGAYADTLALMRRVGVVPEQALLALPLSLRFADGTGLRVPPWAARLGAPLDALVAIAGARGWRARDRIGLLRVALRWRAAGYACAAQATVAEVCDGLGPRAMADLIEPLCVSALNLPAREASGALFLRVLRDAMFAPPAGPRDSAWSPSSLLLPRTDLSTLWPDAAARWLVARGAVLRTGERVQGLVRDGTGASAGRDGGWWLHTDAGPVRADRVVWATGSRAAASALAPLAPGWAKQAAALEHTAITTVYAHAPGAGLAAPLLALRSGPAQFVFDRAALQGPEAAGVLAFVVSASTGERETVERAVLAQAQRELGLSLRPLKTVTERQATFACRPGVVRPGAAIAPGLWAAGDWIDGPYPATLEGAVRSGLAAAEKLWPPPPR